MTSREPRPVDPQPGLRRLLSGLCTAVSSSLSSEGRGFGIPTAPPLQSSPLPLFPGRLCNLRDLFALEVVTSLRTRSRWAPPEILSRASS